MAARKRNTTANPLALFISKLGPTESWKGNCYAKAIQAVETGLVKGVPVYGHWTGPIHRKSMFYRPGLPFARHGWVVMQEGVVCDPTRWVFEHVDPYIYFGPSDHYDEGGNGFRAVISSGPPDFDPGARRFELTKTVMPSRTFPFVEKLLRLDRQYDEIDPGVVTYDQLSWLANRPPQELGEHAHAIYQALDKLGLKALVPIDNWRMIERLHGKP